MRTAIVYDRVNKWGGAEQVLLALHQMFPNAPLYTAVYDRNKAGWAKAFPEIKTSFLQKIPYMQDKHELLGWLTPLAFEQFNFDEYDLVITVTSEAAKGIITKPKTLHICYCLTPTRYLWSHYDTYFKGLSFKGLTKPIVKYLRNWDRIAAQRPDVMIAISTEVKDRIKRYYGRESKIIYPPVDADKYKVSKVSNIPKVSKGDYYLIVSRLVPYKKVDLALEAFAELRLPLVVVGTGSEEEKFKAKFRNKKNIIFKGFTNESEHVDLYQNAKALIFPGEEDFGIVMVEALASGTPVIAFKKGGALDIISDKKTGILFDEQNTKSITEAIGRLRTLPLKKKNLINSSERFSKNIFKNKFLKLIESHMSS